VRRVNFPLTLLLDITQRVSRTAKTSPALLYIAPTIRNNAARRRARAFVRVRVRAHFFHVPGETTPDLIVVAVTSGAISLSLACACVYIFIE
jgi:hypothetical protein